MQVGVPHWPYPFILADDHGGHAAAVTPAPAGPAPRLAPTAKGATDVRVQTPVTRRRTRAPHRARNREVHSDTVVARPRTLLRYRALGHRGLSWSARLDVEEFADLAGGRAQGTLWNSDWQIGLRYDTQARGRLTASILAADSSGSEPHLVGDVQGATNNCMGLGLRLKGFGWQHPGAVFVTGVARAWITQAARPETAYEVTYLLPLVRVDTQLGNRYFLQPDLQYIAHPDGALSPAWVAALRLQSPIFEGRQGRGGLSRPDLPRYNQGLMTMARRSEAET